MNARETAAADKRLNSERSAHLVDAVAIRKALLGTPVALREIEAGAVITICDTYGLDREITARGLGRSIESVEDAIGWRRRILRRAQRDALAAAMAEPAAELVEAVQARNAAAVADVLAGLTDLDLTGWQALAIVLADMAGQTEEGDDDDR